MATNMDEDLASADGSHHHHRHRSSRRSSTGSRVSSSGASAFTNGFSILGISLQSRQGKDAADASTMGMRSMTTSGGTNFDYSTDDNSGTTTRCGSGLQIAIDGEPIDFADLEMPTPDVLNSVALMNCVSKQAQVLEAAVRELRDELATS